MGLPPQYGQDGQPQRCEKHIPDTATGGTLDDTSDRDDHRQASEADEDQPWPTPAGLFLSALGAADGRLGQSDIGWSLAQTHRSNNGGPILWAEPRQIACHRACEDGHQRSEHHSADYGAENVC